MCPVAGTDPTKFFMKQDKELQANVELVTPGITVQACQDMCATNTNFDCQSFNYEVATQTCSLFKEREGTAAALINKVGT